MLVSDRVHLHRRYPVPRGGFDRIGSHARHASVIRGTSAQKTRAAICLFLNDAATRRDRSGAEGIRGPKDSDDGKANGRGNVHGARVVANEKVALR